jgi:hypothetical protein
MNPPGEVVSGTCWLGFFCGPHKHIHPHIGNSACCHKQVGLVEELATVLHCRGLMAGFVTHVWQLGLKGPGLELISMQLTTP